MFYENIKMFLENDIFPMICNTSVMSKINQIISRQFVKRLPNPIYFFIFFEIWNKKKLNCMNADYHIPYI